MGNDRASDLEAAAAAVASQFGIFFELKRHADSGATTDDASTALGIPTDRIVKFLILQRKRGDKRSVGVILRGDERLDVHKVQAAAQINGLSFASADSVKEITGFEVGGVPPPAIASCDIRYLSEGLRAIDTIVGGGGHPHCGMVLAPTELLKIPGTGFADVSH